MPKPLRTKFYTGKGDSGTSAVGKVARSKADPLFDVLGKLDELNSWLGLTRVEAEKFESASRRADVSVPATVERLQQVLFIAQAEVAAMGFGQPRKQKILRKHTAALEKVIAQVDAHVPPLTHFVVPGGSELSARLDVARTTARALERMAIRAHIGKPLSKQFLQFLNRLSSILFALARYVNALEERPEEAPTYK